MISIKLCIYRAEIICSWFLLSASFFSCYYTLCSNIKVILPLFIVRGFFLFYRKSDWRIKSYNCTMCFASLELPPMVRILNVVVADNQLLMECRSIGTSTKRQVSKRQVSKRPVSIRLKRQVYKTSGLQNVWLKKNILIYSVLVVGGNLQVLLQLC